MKILGEKSTSYPIKGSPGSKLQQFRHKKFGYTTSIFMAVTDLLSSFPRPYVECRGYTGSHNGFYALLSWCTGIL